MTDTAHMWQLDGSAWTRLPLTGSHFSLGVNSDSPVQPDGAIPDDGVPAVLGRYAGSGESPTWVLLSRETSSVRVNGKPLLSGMSVLRDRDEILIGGQTRLYFSTEELAKIEPYPGGEGLVFCARCRQPIQPATPAVRCPACGHWCEQSETKPCWTYGPTCPLCDQATAFDAGLRWTPEEL